MKHLPRFVLSVALGLGFLAAGTACKQDSTRAAAPTGHAAKDVVPGSHDDWCAEHEVPESQCTRCDPSLVPAFKATGDWCEEHGLPKSQDVKHDPNLEIVRPPAP